MKQPDISNKLYKMMSPPARGRGLKLLPLHVLRN